MAVTGTHQAATGLQALARGGRVRKMRGRRGGGGGKRGGGGGPSSKPQIPPREEFEQERPFKPAPFQQPAGPQSIRPNLEQPLPAGVPAPDEMPTGYAAGPPPVPSAPMPMPGGPPPMDEEPVGYQEGGEVYDYYPVGYESGSRYDELQDRPSREQAPQYDRDWMRNLPAARDEDIMRIEPPGLPADDENRVQPPSDFNRPLIEKSVYQYDPSDHLPVEFAGYLQDKRDRLNQLIDRPLPERQASPWDEAGFGPGLFSPEPTDIRPPSQRMGQGAFPTADEAFRSPFDFYTQPPPQRTPGPGQTPQTPQTPQAPTPQQPQAPVVSERPTERVTAADLQRSMETAQQVPGVPLSRQLRTDIINDPNYQSPAYRPYTGPGPGSPNYVPPDRPPGTPPDPSKFPPSLQGRPFDPNNLPPGTRVEPQPDGSTKYLLPDGSSVLRTNPALDPKPNAPPTFNPRDPNTWANPKTLNPPPGPGAGNTNPTLRPGQAPVAPAPAAPQTAQPGQPGQPGTPQTLPPNTAPPPIPPGHTRVWKDSRTYIDYPPGNVPGTQPGDAELGPPKKEEAQPNKQAQQQAPTVRMPSGGGGGRDTFVIRPEAAGQRPAEAPATVREAERVTVGGGGGGGAATIRQGDTFIAPPAPGGTTLRSLMSNTSLSPPDTRVRSEGAPARPAPTQQETPRKVAPIRLPQVARRRPPPRAGYQEGGEVGPMYSWDPAWTESQERQSNFRRYGEMLTRPGVPESGHREEPPAINIAPRYEPPRSPWEEVAEAPGISEGRRNITSDQVPDVYRPRFPDEAERGIWGMERPGVPGDYPTESRKYPTSEAPYSPEGEYRRGGPVRRTGYQEGGEVDDGQQYADRSVDWSRSNTYPGAMTSPAFSELSGRAGEMAEMHEPSANVEDRRGETYTGSLERNPTWNDRWSYFRDAPGIIASEWSNQGGMAGEAGINDLVSDPYVKSLKGYFGYQNGGEVGPRSVVDDFIADYQQRGPGAFSPPIRMGYQEGGEVESESTAWDGIMGQVKDAISNMYNYFGVGSAQAADNPPPPPDTTDTTAVSQPVVPSTDLTTRAGTEELTRPAPTAPAPTPAETGPSLMDVIRKPGEAIAGGLKRAGEAITGAIGAGTARTGGALESAVGEIKRGVPDMLRGMGADLGLTQKIAEPMKLLPPGTQAEATVAKANEISPEYGVKVMQSLRDQYNDFAGASMAWWDKGKTAEALQLYNRATELVPNGERVQVTQIGPDMFDYTVRSPDGKNVLAQTAMNGAQFRQFLGSNGSDFDNALHSQGAMAKKASEVQTVSGGPQQRAEQAAAGQAAAKRYESPTTTVSVYSTARGPSETRTRDTGRAGVGDGFGRTQETVTRDPGDPGGRKDYTVMRSEGAITDPRQAWQNYAQQFGEQAQTRPDVASAAGAFPMAPRPPVNEAPPQAANIPAWPKELQGPWTQGELQRAQAQHPGDRPDDLNNRINQLYQNRWQDYLTGTKATAPIQAAGVRADTAQAIAQMRVDADFQKFAMKLEHDTAMAGDRHGAQLLTTINAAIRSPEGWQSLDPELKTRAMDLFERFKGGATGAPQQQQQGGLPAGVPAGAVRMTDSRTGQVFFKAGDAYYNANGVRVK